MIGTPELYNLYKLTQKLKVQSEINKVSKLEKKKNELIDFNKNYVKAYSDYKGKDYYFEYNTLDMPVFPLKENIELMNKALVVTKGLFKQLVEINKEIKELTEIIDRHHNNKITLKIYSDVIRMMNQEMIEEIVKGYVLKMGCLGQILVVRKKRKPGTNVDWGNTHKLKQALIEEGKKILQYDLDEENNVINNGGEPYFLFHNSEEAYWLIWDRTRQTFFDEENYPLFKYYNILFTKGEDDKGSIMRLVRTYQNDKFAHLRYPKR